ncbi:MAG TPA: amidohydrolase family protein [Solirubrobacteraceae bacterium]|jgi:cytosine/adenosine deaminase-related metal-dependent hydrolase|nr:amidohydrolase family protein [Solirubrobacteraceae bacterium]
MRTLLRNITVIAMDDEHGSEPFSADVLVVDDLLAEVAPPLSVAPAAGDTVINGTDRLLTPGLINAHLHSWEALLRGRYDNMPLELWMLLSYPILGLDPLPERLIHLRTLMVAIESLKNGVTCVLDDVIESPGQSLEALEAVFAAYAQSGIRANCSGNIVNRYFSDTIPFANELLPAEVIARVHANPPPTTEEYLAFSREALRRFDGREGRLRYVIAPSGPQRCTDDLLIAADELSAEHDTTYHIHVLETKVQAVTGQEFYGDTLVAYLDRLGVLSERSTLAHGIWLTDADIEMLARSGASVAHNAISNQKLGAGIAPLRKLLDAGVNVGLGSDGGSSSDSARMLDVIKAAALLHKLTTPDYTQWPSATEVLWAATRGGAASMRLAAKTGQVAPGFKADLVVFDLRTINFTPRNDLRNHLVYSENGTSIEQVMVDGRVVVRDGACTQIDEASVLAELRELAPEFLARHGKVEEINQVFAPHFAEIHRRCCGVALPINRYSGDEATWLTGDQLPV